MHEIISYPFEANGVLTRVLEAGSGPDVVVFVHGVGARADRWRKNLPAVASAGFRAIALDLPGHGFAQKGPGFAYGVPAYAAFVSATLDGLGIGSAHFVGTSLGAHILSTVHLRRERVARSLTLVGATGMFPIGEEARQRIAGRIRDLSRDGIRQKLQTVMFDGAEVTERLVEEEWRINSSPGALESFEALAAYFRERLDADAIGDDLAADTALPHKPLLIWGDSDRSVVISIGQRVEQLLGTPLVRIPEAAHAPYWERPEAFNSVLVPYLLKVNVG